MTTDNATDNATPLSLYARLVAAGVGCNNWQSDLYFPATPETAEILEAAARDGVVVRGNVRKFRSNVTRGLSYEAPFCFDPYWQNRCTDATRVNT